MMTLPSESIFPLAHLAPITLADLQEEAAFLTRADKKYLVPLEVAGQVIAAVEPGTRVLEIDGKHDFRYVSPYFDDAQSTAYYSAARRRAARFKVRTRLYCDSGLCMLELKVRDARGRTVKHRTTHDADALESLLAADRDWLRAFPHVAPYADALRHCMTTHYVRTTLALPDGGGRVTIDRDLTFAMPDGERRTLPDLVIIETKGTGRPTSFDRLLWRHGVRPQAMSKFNVGLALLIPDLPANRWHRIRTRLDAVADRTPAPMLAFAAD
ncbi:MAG: polyphosphate polymerase domain-containing protein [Thermomicrobiales bacterium]